MKVVTTYLHNFLHNFSQHLLLVLQYRLHHCKQLTLVHFNKVNTFTLFVVPSFLTFTFPVHMIYLHVDVSLQNRLRLEANVQFLQHRNKAIQPINVSFLSMVWAYISRSPLQCVCMLSKNVNYLKNRDHNTLRKVSLCGVSKVVCKDAVFLQSNFKLFVDGQENGVVSIYKLESLKS